MNRKAVLDRAIWCRISPFIAYVFFMLLAELLSRYGWSAHELRLLYAVKIAVVAALLWTLRGAYAELRLPHGAGVMTWGVAAVAGAVVFVAWINLKAGWMEIGVSAGFNPSSDAGIDWMMAAARLMGAILVVPLMEELFWRSFLMRWIARHDFLAVEPARAGSRAFVISALLFAFEHNLWLAGLLAGVFYNLLYMRSGTLWSPILAHAVTNALLGVWVIYTGNWSYW
ncbi:MAG: CAAX prenyl protease-related protein [Gallionella sp.]|nr:CAAX prenyl protease-related protein [Gallionella sp.]